MLKDCYSNCCLMPAGVHDEKKIFFFKSHKKATHGNTWWFDCCYKYNRLGKCCLTAGQPFFFLPNFPNRMLHIITCHFINKEARGLPPLS